eukprot:3389398-Prymnesium_polylepis.2
MPWDTRPKSVQCRSLTTGHRMRRASHPHAAAPCGTECTPVFHPSPWPRRDPRDRLCTAAI